MSKSIATTSKLLNKKFQSKSAMIKHLYFIEKKEISEISKAEGILYQMCRNIIKIEENNRFFLEHSKKDTSEETQE